MKETLKNRIKEYGDFQTPEELSLKILYFLLEKGLKPSSIIDPTCGTGSFILASLEVYPKAQISGYDINSKYLRKINLTLQELNKSSNINIKKADFFRVLWDKEFNLYPEPILVVGNPPWITSSELSIIRGTNIPEKANIYGYKGIEAITGKSNFDISEWMIIELLKALNKRHATLAMLCKVSVARKIIIYLTQKKIEVKSIRMYLIDAQKYFRVSVKACLFICELSPNCYNYLCSVYQNLHKSSDYIQILGYVENHFVANMLLYEKVKYLCKNVLSSSTDYVWRSGIKHDCNRIMELEKQDNDYINGFNEVVKLEENYLFPMLKSSDLVKNSLKNITRRMIVTQKFIGEDTSKIKKDAPLTWNYLEKYSKILKNRASSIYKNRPAYSIFGIGTYTFSPWKIAISGFYKNLNFKRIGLFQKKPIVLDDTCYFLPIYTKEKAILIELLLNHRFTKEFFEAFIFWDVKRPIKKQILQKLDLKKLLSDLDYTELIESVLTQFPKINLESLKIQIDEF